MHLLRKFKLAIAIARNGSGPFHTTLLFFWSIYTYLADVCALPSIAIRPIVRIYSSRYRILLRTLSDLWVLKDVLVDREYEFAELPPASIVVDLGCNIGISSLFLAARFPDAHIYAVEPGPSIRNQLEENVAQEPRISVHPFALAASDGPVEFAVSGRAISGSLAALGEESVMVKGVGASSLLTILGIECVDILKFDIEGAERYLFPEGIMALMPEAAIGEMHYDLNGLSPVTVRESLPTYLFEEQFVRKQDRSLICARRIAST